MEKKLSPFCCARGGERVQIATNGWEKPPLTICWPCCCFGSCALIASTHGHQSCRMVCFLVVWTPLSEALHRSSKGEISVQKYKGPKCCLLFYTAIRVFANLKKNSTMEFCRDEPEENNGITVLQLLASDGSIVIVGVLHCNSRPWADTSLTDGSKLWSKWANTYYNRRFTEPTKIWLFMEMTVVVEWTSRTVKCNCQARQASMLSMQPNQLVILYLVQACLFLQVEDMGSDKTGFIQVDRRHHLH